MAVIDFSDLDIPTPAAFDENIPTKQMENLAYVKLQIYAKMKAAGFTQSDFISNATEFDVGDVAVKIYGEVATVETL